MQPALEEFGILDPLGIGHARQPVIAGEILCPLYPGEATSLHIEDGAFKARAGLLNECDRLMLCAHRESRGLTVDERQSFDEHMEKIRELSGFLAEIRKQQVAEITAQGFPPEYCRSPY